MALPLSLIIPIIIEAFEQGGIESSKLKSTGQYRYVYEIPYKHSKYILRKTERTAIRNISFNTPKL